jgi:catechol 2,3-dioxygenase-like lactoylglutathione lyase family enzyme
VKLAQVILFAKDVARMKRFYAGALGLRPLDEPATDDWVRLDAGGCVLALHGIPPHVAAHVAVGDPPAAREDTPMKLAFHVDDVDAARASLVAAGATMREPKRFGEVALCDGLDPEGNVFQITTR